MRGFAKFLIAAAGLLGVAASVPAVAAPVAPAPIENAARDGAPVQDVRLYCHRGPVFLHWGPCRHDAWRYGYDYRPRYYRPYYRPYYRHYYRPWHHHRHYW
jgi:hypothetical protein